MADTTRCLVCNLCVASNKEENVGKASFDAIGRYLLKLTKPGREQLFENVPVFVKYWAADDLWVSLNGQMTKGV